MPNYSKNEVILVRYPFSNLSGSKVRPAVVVNGPHVSQDVIIVPVTSKVSTLVHGEFVLADWHAAGLNVSSAAKRGLYTVHQSLIVKSVGRLSSKAQLAHIKTAVYFERVNLWLGIPVVILTTLVGTSVFASLQKEATTSIRIAAGVASVLAAIMAGLHTFLRYSERAERHRISGGKYGTLRREIEQKLAFPPSNSDELRSYVDSLSVGALSGNQVITRSLSTRA